MIFLLSVLTILNFNSPKMEIDSAWVRPAAKGMNSALYFDLRNNTSNTDTLIKVSSPVAELVQVHETLNKNGLMEMKEVKSLGVHKNQIIKFAPGGYHVMLIKLKKDLKAGAKVGFVFYFKKAGKIKVTAVVKSY
ncbi:MAG: copper chaperone PCu(A)C [Bacteroidetes bacterium]|nr:copper chaperone PCu(A)C [Bacteroidota bacterium]